MVEKNSAANLSDSQTGTDNNSHEEENIDPQDISKNKEPNDEIKIVRNNEKDFDDDSDTDSDVTDSELDNGLDIRGAEMDDEQENTRSEDEENNSYNLNED